MANEDHGVGYEAEADKRAGVVIVSAYQAQHGEDDRQP